MLLLSVLFLGEKLGQDRLLGLESAAALGRLDVRAREGNIWGYPYNQNMGF